ncbi:MAG: type I DNA topoisomerase [Bacteroidota bacterium]|nr:type I DNA topoisomerase [Bacteroidota bacterium]
MASNLVIVESPAKAKTIEGFLGKDFLVKSSFGHVRDLYQKELSIDIANDFKPHYEISPDKKKLIEELKQIAKKSDTVWLASDEDREGEAISWHLSEALNLDMEKTKRIVFHEITKTAILEAIKNPRGIDLNLVDAQQARRVLDRLVGFELSPVLWKKIKPSLSAGRVQSVAVRLIVEREKEINAFNEISTYKVTGQFFINKGNEKVILKADLSTKFDTKEEALNFLNKCAEAEFTISDIETKPAKKSPAPPFTTSTLQQEASRKLNFSVSKTMVVAQQLYEAGKITYMRTDSVNLSDMAIDLAKTEITKSYGHEYSRVRKYTTKTKGAQEAHEAIRPTYMNNHTIEGDAAQKKLYDLIWKRTLASQMSDALLEKTNVTIDISTTPEKFIAKGEVLKFDGFLKVYMESTDDDIEDDESKGMLPPLNKGQKLDPKQIDAIQKYSQHPPRYTEASLVKKLEELGIGRPSTYAPTISTIQKRGYVVNEDRKGTERNYEIITLEENKIKETGKTEVTGTEKSKLFPTDIGTLVNDFLVSHFDRILDYNFTANVEKEFDKIAQGLKIWNEMIKGFYSTFHKNVENVLGDSERPNYERHIGIDPKTGKNVIVRMGRFGPVIQLGDNSEEEKPRFASPKKDQRIETITLEEALKQFELPRTIGSFEDEDMIAAIGKFGPYIRHKSAFYSLPKEDDPLSIGKDRAIEIILAKRQKDIEKVINIFKHEDKDIQVLNGRWGAYIAVEKTNYKIPKKTDPKSLTLDDCLKIINETPQETSNKKTYSKTTKKK